MKVLILSPYGQLIEETIVKGDDTAILREAMTEVSDWPECDWVISFGYRKIIPKYIIDKFEGRIINIHISVLPYNRGAEPNFWSWFDGTPKGVSIHRVNEKIDDGEALFQRVVGIGQFRQPTTLRTTYEDLVIVGAGLFRDKWDKIRKNELPEHIWNRFPYCGEAGSYHKAGDEDKFMKYFPKGYDTHVQDIVDLGRLYYA